MKRRKRLGICSHALSVAVRKYAHASGRHHWDVLGRYRQVDWGDVLTNEETVEHGLAVVSALVLSNSNSLRIVNEADRALTQMALEWER